MLNYSQISQSNKQINFTTTVQFKKFVFFQRICINANWNTCRRLQYRHNLQEIQHHHNYNYLPTVSKPEAYHHFVLCLVSDRSHTNKRTFQHRFFILINPCVALFFGQYSAIDLICTASTTPELSPKMGNETQRNKPAANCSVHVQALGYKMNLCLHEFEKLE